MPLFRKLRVVAPAYTLAFDALARFTTPTPATHRKDDRGHTPEKPDDPFVSMFLPRHLNVT